VLSRAPCVEMKLLHDNRKELSLREGSCKLRLPLTGKQVYN
jgi:hypothetical protein